MGVVTAMAAAAALASGAQDPGLEPAETGYEIYACGSRIVQAPPSEAAMALGRRLARLFDMPAIAARIDALMAKAEGGPLPGTRPGAGGPIRAVSPLDSIRNVDWRVALADRATERAATVYARRWPEGDMEAIARFFESAAGERFLAERAAIGDAVRAALAGPELEAEFRAIVCRPRDGGGPADGPSHAYLRLPQDRLRESPRPAWCDAAPAD